MTMIEARQFIKGSIWETDQPMRFGMIEVPAGTRFEVMYPRRRETNIVGIKFNDKPRQSKFERSIDRMKVRLAKRFPKADLMIGADKLLGVKQISVPPHHLEFYIREIATGHLWSGGADTSAMFRKIGFDEANHFVSASNARVGILTLLGHNKRSYSATKADPEIPLFEVVSMDTQTGRDMGVMVYTQQWWSNAVRIMRAKTNASDDSTAKEIRKAANGMPMDNQQWSALMMGVDKTTPHEVMSGIMDLGITDYIAVDKVFLLKKDSDRVLAKVFFGDTINTIIL